MGSIWFAQPDITRPPSGRLFAGAIPTPSPPARTAASGPARPSAVQRRPPPALGRHRRQAHPRRARCADGGGCAARGAGLARRRGDGRRREDSNPCRGLRRRKTGFEAHYLTDGEFTALGRALDDGESLHVAGRPLGHRQASTTSRYVHLDDATLSQAAERVAGPSTPRCAAGRPAGTERRCCRAARSRPCFMSVTRYFMSTRWTYSPITR